MSAEEKTPEEEQADLLRMAKTKVKQQSHYMKKALDNENRDEALKYASTLISVLSTSDLRPQNYYDLYMACFDELRYLEDYFLDEWKKGSSIFDLYELVQHANKMLPRLYLLVTVGSVYIRSKEAPAKDVLKDLVEMCRGVQHPMRGLFLRSYLSQLSKDKLPDSDNQYEGAGGTVRDSIDFILQNFTEMNKLWVRMQHQGPIREKERRERERNELRILVGTNLVRLSQLEGVNLELYSTVVLRRILEQVINCKDPIAQEYLMDCIIQVFPDEYHLRTLDAFLETIESLHQSVDVKHILVTCMDRISRYAEDPAVKIPEEVDGFKIFSEHVEKVISTQTTLGLDGVLNLQASLAKFARTCYPDKLEYVDTVFGNCIQALTGADPTEYGRNIVQLLSIPLAGNADVLQILDLKHFPGLMEFLHSSKRKEVASQLCKSLIASNSALNSTSMVEDLFNFIQPLIVEDEAAKDVDEDAEDEDEDDETKAFDKAEFEEEQNLVARLVHLLQPDDSEKSLDVLYKLYVGTRKMFGKGGKERIKYTLPPLITNALQLACKLKKLEAEAEAAGGAKPFSTSSKNVLKFCHITATSLKDNGHSDLALRMFLLCAQGAGQCGLPTITYEFFQQAFSIFEEDVSDSKAQFAAITLMIGVLRDLQGLSEEDRITMVKALSKAAAKLLKKQDACRAIYLASHLFWGPPEAEGEEPSGRRQEKLVLDCLRKALKIADQCQQTSAKHLVLFVDILNQYVYFYESGYTDIKKYIPSLLALINEHVANATGGDDNSFAVYYTNTVRSMKEKKHFAEIEFA